MYSPAVMYARSGSLEPGDVHIFLPIGDDRTGIRHTDSDPI